jgi:putative transcriptional regulator
MAKMTEKELLERDAKRNIGEEMLAAAREMKAGVTRSHRVHRFRVSDVAQTRTSVGLSQQKFARVLGVSARTLQAWEQGQRTPSGAARSLLAIAKRRPEVLREIFAE